MYRSVIGLIQEKKNPFTSLNCSCHLRGVMHMQRRHLRVPHSIFSFEGLRTFRFYQLHSFNFQEPYTLLLIQLPPLHKSTCTSQQEAFNNKMKLKIMGSGRKIVLGVIMMVSRSAQENQSSSSHSLGVMTQCSHLKGEREKNFRTWPIQLTM